MVAVALMPPLVAFGMLLGAGYMQASLGPLTLLAANLICLNLAGVEPIDLRQRRVRARR